MFLKRPECLQDKEQIFHLISDDNNIISQDEEKENYTSTARMIFGISRYDRQVSLKDYQFACGLAVITGDPEDQYASESVGQRYGIPFLINQPAVYYHSTVEVHSFAR